VTLSPDELGVLFPHRQVLPLTADDPDRVGDHELLCRLPPGGQSADVFVGRSGDDRVVVKMQSAEASRDAIERFRAEVANASRISSPRVARVLDSDLEAQRPYFVQQFVDGTPLSELLEQRQRQQDRQRAGLNTEELRRLAVGLLLAIEDVHSAGVVHRDVKPGNVIITPDGDVVLVDFGISRLSGEDGSLTRTSQVVFIGSHLFASPEQIGPTSRLTPATDVYSWGLVVATAAGRYPADPTADLATHYQNLLHDHLDLSALPPDLAAPVRAALRPRAQDRPTVSRLVQQVESATRWYAVPDSAIAQPRWRLEDALRLGAVRYQLGQLERAIVDSPAHYAAALVLGGLLGSGFGLLLAVLWSVML
jgi:serine/threonine protein kinase